MLKPISQSILPSVNQFSPYIYIELQINTMLPSSSVHYHPRTMPRWHICSRCSEEMSRRSGGLRREVSGEKKAMEIPHMYSCIGRTFTIRSELAIEELLNTQKNKKSIK